MPTFFESRMFDAVLVALWATLGSIWLPFGSPWLTFGSLWLPSGDILGKLLMKSGIDVYFEIFDCILLGNVHFEVFVCILLGNVHLESIRLHIFGQCVP